MGYDLKLLTLGTGSCPFEEWYVSIRDTQARARIRSRLTRLRSGNFGDLKSVGGGVSELRLDFGPGYRVYFGRIEQRVIVLVAGGDKRSQRKDIEFARDAGEKYRDEAERFQRDF